MTFFQFIEKIVHGDEKAPPSEIEGSVLDALEWSDTDSGEDLVERADEISTPAAHA